MRKILTIIGARPQFIKSAALSHTLRTSFSDSLTEVIVHTGQHYDYAMSTLFFEQMGLPQPGHTLSLSTTAAVDRMAEMLVELNRIIQLEKPDCILVFGDTDSTLAGAIAGDMNQIPIAHVEAGLRSFRNTMPEERNRKITDHLSTWLFVPGVDEIQQLATEGIVPHNAPKNSGQVARTVVAVGDIMLDTLNLFRPALQNHSIPGVNTELPYILLTIHRNFNTDNPARLKNIFSGLATLYSALKVPILFPVHPRTMQAIDKLGLQLPEGLRCMPPQGYLETQVLIQHSGLVITDSGGLQKEAFFHGKYGLILRDTTEWKSLLKHEYSVCIDDNVDAMVMHGTKWYGKTLDTASPLFGNGTASRQILEHLLQGL